MPLKTASMAAMMSLERSASEATSVFSKRLS
jgi:hypothetical protein